MAKLAGDGTLLWQQALDGTSRPDEATSVVVDHEGNVLAVGDLDNSTTADDITVAKFAGGDGTLLWRQTLNGTANAFDHANSVAVDHEGNVFAAGTINNTNTGFDFMVAKFAAVDGTLLWRQTLNGTAANPIDSANSVAVDHEGNVLAAGTFRNQFPNTNAAFTVVKFAGDGTLLWRQALRGTSGSFGGSANSVIVDSEGNVIAAGTINNQRTVDDFTVAKFTGDGTLLWQQTLAAFNDLLSASDAANSVAVDHEGNVLAAGVIQNLSYDDDFTVAKFGTDWTFCAPEGGVCAFTGTTEVRYGAIGSFVVKTLADGTACINDVFGDPIYGNVKECATRTTPRPTEWTFCATEGDTCAFTGASAVRYGANGAFFFKNLTDGTAVYQRRVRRRPDIRHRQAVRDPEPAAAGVDVLRGGRRRVRVHGRQRGALRGKRLFRLTRPYRRHRLHQRGVRRPDLRRRQELRSANRLTIAAAAIAS